MVSDAELKQDIDYIMHIEHELPMEWYTQLEATKADLVKMIQIHIEAELKRSESELKLRIAEGLKREVGSIILETQKAHHAW